MSNHTELEKAFNSKLTENGDLSYKSTGNHLLDLLFMSQYFRNHLDEVTIGSSPKEQLFSMLMRDPRLGIGERDLGRKLMHLSGVSPQDIVKAGRFDDLLYAESFEDWKDCIGYLYSEILKDNQLAKKWAPRYSSKDKLKAIALSKAWGMNKKAYSHFIKCDTTENKLSRHRSEDIIFSQVPSLALLKYWNRFSTGSDTAERFNEWLQEVRSGNSKMNISTANPYDIYRYRDDIDTDLVFDKLEKVSGNWLPVVDTSGSMMDSQDSIGKATSIGHYLAKTSTYMPDTVISFSSEPILIKLGKNRNGEYRFTADKNASKYINEVHSMYTGDCSNTDLGKVMEILSGLKKDVPEYLVILSDMEFDMGSSCKKDELMQTWKELGYNTKIIWWNFNSRAKTAPEMDDYGNIFMSGYNPMLLKYLEAGFDGEKFLDKILEEYEKSLNA